jgi:hypothetical protein
MADTDIQAEPPDPARKPVRPVDAEEVEPVEPYSRPQRRARQSDDYDDDFGPRGGDDDPVQMVIPYKNPLALVSYYCGVFSLIPCAALILGPTAIVLGMLGYRRRKLDPRAHGTGHAIAGIVLGSITSLANYGLLIAGIVMILTHRQ